LAVSWIETEPVVSVVGVVGVNVALAPVVGSVTVTTAAGTGLPRLSTTLTTTGWANAVVASVLWPPPLLTTTVLGALAVLVSTNEAGVAIPLTVAVTVNVPAVAFAIATMLVCPLELVVGSVAASETEAPVEGATYWTETPGTPLPKLSATVTMSGWA
jgi:hypothetical protein